MALEALFTTEETDADDEAELFSSNTKEDAAAEL